MEPTVVIGAFVAIAAAALRWGADSRDGAAGGSLAAWAVGRAGAKREMTAVIDLVELELARARAEELRAAAAAPRAPARGERPRRDPLRLPRAAAFQLGTRLVGWGERLVLYAGAPRLAGRP